MIFLILLFVVLVFEFKKKGFFLFLSIFLLLIFYQNFFVECYDCNVIFISPDLLRKEQVGLFSNQYNTTPFTDSFFEDSLIFPRAYSTGVWTLPSQVSLLTGLYPNEHKVEYRLAAPLSEEFSTVAEAFKKEGYLTANFNGGVDLGEAYGMDRGFDFFSSGFFFQNSVKKSISFLEQTNGRKFFLYIHGFDAHDPYFKAGDFTRELNYSGALNDAFLSLPFLRKGNFFGSLSSTDKEFLKAAYMNNVKGLDIKLEVLYDYLRSSGLEDNTIIVFLPSHGENIFEGGDVGHHAHFQGAINVPLMIKAPFLRKGVSNNVVELVNVFPKIFDWIGLKKLKQFHDDDLLNSDNLSFSMIFREVSTFAIVDDDLKVIFSSFFENGEHTFFNLTNDPYEESGFENETLFFDYLQKYRGFFEE